jgi:uncharacterized repeat protein (TIGR03943 family)
VTLSVRTGRLLALSAWAACLAWLQVSGQVARYLGPRTAWVVPVGALGLTLAAVLYARETVGSPVAGRGLGRREGAGLAALLAPALVVLCMADATLGSLAASNKLSSRGVDFSSLAGSLSHGGSDVDFLVIRGADEDPAVARARDITPGRPVSLTGFVLAAPGHGAPLRLARFYITCCIADSVAIDVPVYLVHPDPGLRRDQWLTVSGVLARRGRRFVLEAATARHVRQPRKPYLLFRV